MSGIAGYLGAPQELSVLQTMVRKLAHRGPDAEGFHIEAPVFMGMRRLATIDPAENWLPLYSDDRKLAIAFAGELVNYREERAHLEQRGHKFRTQTDTEVVLQLYAAYGQSCVARMRGQFAFAIHDMERNLVFMARDHLGMQPLYYATTRGGSLVFASEIKSILEHPGITAEPNMMVVDAYLTLGYSPGPTTLFKGIHSLPPGHRLTWNPGLHVMVEPYWQWENFSKPDPSLKSDADFQARFDSLLEEAVRARMVGDVPVGAVVTGSLESAAILAAMVGSGTRTPQTFSTAFGPERDGTPPGPDIAARLGCPVEQVTFEPEYMDRLPELVWANDQPNGDAPHVLSHHLTRMASQKVKVLMSGIGANNLFVNYPQHDILLAAHNVPKYFWWFYKETNKLLPLATIAKKLQFTGKIGPRAKMRLFDFTEQMRNGDIHQQYICLAALIDARDKQSLYKETMSPYAGALTDRHCHHGEWPSFMSMLLAMQDDHLLEDGIISPVNKLAAFNGVGLRAPLMDHKLFEFMLGVPDHLRRHGKRRKILLRNYVDRMLPGLVQAPPRENPVGGQPSLLELCMTRGPLREMLETCLSENSIRKRGLLEPEVVRRMLTEAKAGETLQMRQVFSLLGLELWFRIFIDHEKGWISS